MDSEKEIEELGKQYTKLYCELEDIKKCIKDSSKYNIEMEDTKLTLQIQIMEVFHKIEDYWKLQETKNIL